VDAETITCALETIERNARLQSQLIDDILDLSRIMQGKLRLQLFPVQLMPMIKAAVNSMRPSAEAKAIQLECIVNPSVGKVLGDPTRLQQIVWNLLSNAIKFTPEAGQVKIYLAQIQDDNSPETAFAEIQVIDTGKGIQEDFLPYVFDRFQQADSSTTRADGGLGLGLAIVRYLVNMHKGTVQAASPGIGQGATFTVRLPLLGGEDTV
jgi:signal transduction histidine kinase